MPSVPPEPGPEATHREYVDWLTAHNLMFRFQLTEAQRARLEELESRAILLTTPTKDEPDQ